MIGDQLDRDIVPAASAGYRTLYYPSAFLPRWHKQIEENCATAIVRDYFEGVRFATTDVNSQASSVA
jgi:hypothetical protein